MFPIAAQRELHDLWLGQNKTSLLTFSPCDLLALFRGRTIWLSGDSQQQARHTGKRTVRVRLPPEMFARFLVPTSACSCSPGSVVQAHCSLKGPVRGLLDSLTDLGCTSCAGPHSSREAGKAIVTLPMDYANTDVTRAPAGHDEGSDVFPVRVGSADLATHGGKPFVLTSASVQRTTCFAVKFTLIPYLANQLD